MRVGQLGETRHIPARLLADTCEAFDRLADRSIQCITNTGYADRGA